MERVDPTASGPALSVSVDERVRPRRRRLVVAAVVAIVALAGAVAWGWWTHPTAFRDLGASVSSGPRPVGEAAVSTTVVLPKVDGSPESIRLDDLRATFSTNTAAARATFSVCHMRAGEDPIGVAYDPGSVCGELEAFRAPMMFDYGVAPDSDYLVVTITPTQRGRAQLESVDLTYRRSAGHAFQTGTQTIRVGCRVVAR